MFCVSCKRISPAGSVYCAYCPGRRCFNGIMCKNNHRNQIGTKTCPHCGTDEFSDHTWGLPTGYMVAPLTLLAVAYLWKIGLAHGSDIGHGLWVGTSHVFGFLTNSDENALYYLLRSAAAYLFLTWVIGLVFSVGPGSVGKFGNFLKGIPWQLVCLLWKGLPKVLGLLWRSGAKASGLVRGKGSAPFPLSGKDKGGSGS
jgi:hypothetical protein